MLQGQVTVKIEGNTENLIEVLYAKTWENHTTSHNTQVTTQFGHS